MDLKSCSKILTDIYIVANTPGYLYDAMRTSPVICDYLSKKDENELIKEFNIRVSTSVSNISEIAEIYGIVVALTFKKGENIERFFKYVKENIKFEWFSKIAELYLSSKSTLLEDTIFDASPSFNVGNSNQFQIKVP